MTENEKESIRKIYIDLHSRLIRIASFYYDYRQAEDLVQEAFQIACSKPKALLQAENPELWMLRTLRNVIRNKRRMDIRWHQVLVPLHEWYEWEGENTASYRLEEELLLPEHIDGIRDADLELFYRIALYGETVNDEAQRLHITVWACRKRYQRTRARLAKLIDQDEL